MEKEPIVEEEEPIVAPQKVELIEPEEIEICRPHVEAENPIE